MFQTVTIENLWPQIEGGKYPVKRIPGEPVTVYADIFKEGHEIISAVVKWRDAGTRKWNETPMTAIGNDRWTATFPAGVVGFTEWTIEAWGDTFLSWLDEIGKKVRGGAVALPTETAEGAGLIRAAAASSTSPHRIKGRPCSLAAAASGRPSPRSNTQRTGAAS